MKIALLRISSVFGGVEKHVFSLARYFKTIGHNPVLVFRDKYLVERAWGDGLEAYYVRKRFKLDVLFLWNLSKLLRKISPDIVHSHGILSDFCAALLLPRISGKSIRHVITIHSLPWIGFGLGKPRAFVYKKMHEFSIRRSSAVVVVSKWLEKEISNRDLTGRKTSVVYNGVDWQRFDSFYSLRMERKKRKRDNKILIGFAGRLSREKGVDYLVRSLSVIVKKHLIPMEIQGIVAGDGEERKSLERLIATSNLSGKVKLIGFQEAIEKFLINLDIFVLPSIIEGFPMILLEVGAMGIPVVATEVGGIPELIRNGKEGLLVPPRAVEDMANAIARLANSPALQREMAEHLRSRISKNFTLENMAERTLESYKGIVS